MNGREQGLPKNMIAIDTDAYARLDAVDRLDFVENRWDTSVLGGPGLGKTHTLRTVLRQTAKGRFAYLEGHKPPEQFYIWLYENRAMDFLVLEDFGFVDPKLLELLMQATDADPETGLKTIRWGNRRGVPRDPTSGKPIEEFTTRAALYLGTNYWPSGIQGDALASRFRAVFVFDPPVAEWLTMVEGWLCSTSRGQEVWAYLGSVAHSVRVRDARLVKAALDRIDKQSAFPWRVYLDRLCVKDPAVETMLAILDAKDYANVRPEKLPLLAVRVFCEQTGRSREAAWRALEEAKRVRGRDDLVLSLAGHPLADRILGWLEDDAAGMTGTQIRDRLGRNRSGEEIQAATSVLLDLGLARFDDESTGGRPARRWIATSTTEPDRTTEAAAPSVVPSPSVVSNPTTTHGDSQ